MSHSCLCCLGLGGIATDPIVISDEEADVEKETVNRGDTSQEGQGGSDEWTSHTVGDVPISDDDMDVAAVEAWCRCEEASLSSQKKVSKQHEETSLISQKTVSKPYEETSLSSQKKVSKPYEETSLSSQKKVSKPYEETSLSSQKEPTNQEPCKSTAAEQGVRFPGNRNIGIAAKERRSKRKRKRRRAEVRCNDKDSQEDDDIPLNSLFIKQGSADSESVNLLPESSDGWDVILSSIRESPAALVDTRHTAEKELQGHGTILSSDENTASGLDSRHKQKSTSFVESQVGTARNSKTFAFEVLPPRDHSHTGSELPKEDVTEEDVEDTCGRGPFLETAASPSNKEEADFSLDAISKQLENSDMLNDDMSFWMEDDFNSNLLWNSQDVLIEEELINTLDTESPTMEEACDETPGLLQKLNEVPPEQGIPPASKTKESIACASVEQQSNSGYGNEPIQQFSGILNNNQVTQVSVQHKEGAKTSGTPSESVAVLPPAVTEPKKPITVEDFLREVLEWKVQWLREGNGRGLPKEHLGSCVVPLSFDNMDVYYNTFRPLMLLETWEQVGLIGICPCNTAWHFYASNLFFLA